MKLDIALPAASAPIVSAPAVRRQTALSTAHLWEILALSALLLLGFGLRMLNLNDPPLDFHSTRQLRAAIIARGMYFADLPNADPQQRQTAIDIWTTMERYEPPILERLVALTYRVLGGEHLWVARVYSSLFWVIGGAVLYALVRRALSRAGALFALAFYLILPWGVIASRAFQPDPWMVMWVLLAAYALYRWVEDDLRSWLWTALAGLFCGLAMLIKAYALYPVAGMALFLLVSQVLEGGPTVKGIFTQAVALLRRPQLWIFAGLSALLPGVYYLGLGDRSSSFASFWILSFTGLLTDRKFYIQWLGLIRGIVDAMAFFAALLGVFLFPRRGLALMLGFWLGYFLIGLTFPFQIHTHDYYSILLVPLVAISLAPLAHAMFSRIWQQPVILRVVFVLALLGMGGYYTWVARSQVVVSNHTAEPYPWMRMGQDLPSDGSIIALTHDYGNRLKYFGWRTVNRLWPSQGDLNLSAAAGGSGYGDFAPYFEEQTAGMDFFLVTLFGDLESQPDLKAMLYDHYPIAQQGDGYVLFDLRSPQP